MPDLGFVVYLIAVSYALGVVWHTLLGRGYTSWMRLAAFPLVGTVLGETLVTIGPSLFALHLYVALVSTFIAVTADIAFNWIGEQSPVSKMGKQAVKQALAVLGR